MTQEEKGKLYRIDFREDEDGEAGDIMIVLASGETPVIKMLMKNLQTTLMLARGVTIALTYERGDKVLRADKDKNLDESGEIYSISFNGSDNEAEEILVFAIDEASVIRFLIEYMQISLMEAATFDVMESYERGEGVIKIDDDGNLDVSVDAKEGKGKTAKTKEE